MIFYHNIKLKFILCKEKVFLSLDDKGCKKIFFATFCHIFHANLQKNEIKITKKNRNKI